MQCECIQDGFCKRYNKDMYGRMWQLCQGINVDIGTAAAFRLQWQRESLPQVAKIQRRLLLKTNQAPGDAVCLTAAIYSLHKAYPGGYVTSVESPYPEVFEGNMYISAASGGEPLEMHYPAIHDCNTRGIHFMQAWCEFLSFALDIQVPLLTNRPHLYAKSDSCMQPYWVVCSGGKSDMTNKIWPYYQEVVDSTNLRFVQVGMDQQPLHGVVDLVGKTTLQQLFSIVKGAQGVLCGVSLLMHVAAAFEKLCIVIAGGREPVQWNSYPKQHYIHTIGQLDCCLSGGCWKSNLQDCLHPVGQIPKCMTMIDPIRVTNLLRSFV